MSETEREKIQGRACQPVFTQIPGDVDPHSKENLPKIYFLLFA